MSHIQGLTLIFLGGEKFQGCFFGYLFYITVTFNDYNNKLQ